SWHRRPLLQEVRPMRFPSLRDVVPGRRHCQARRVRSRAPHKRPAGCRLEGERLEERALLSAYTFTPIAANSGMFSGFSGLPTISREGRVAFQGNLATGGSGIFTASGGPLTTVVTTGDLLSAVSPSIINGAGTVSFKALLTAGGEGVFTGSGGPLSIIATR